ncbi:hypothetical protein L336_0961 [Candidatus Saccharimonas aalborgensis]|uniref:Uncharacterized protein n=1 Tax=Candidatus Saccharimonas aalborgensis TaxID=1332188 RepID=R4PWK6_9BACT|nr:hypothetical protein [Candidatus Saccharimonas aalborgensis]AGL62660.1 hypothetical protein L336_0961 [Candidatus Saccharimonas aalborgensis]QQS68160.1 MAG: hypothetical protein IPP24_04070 [Candidatus Saccharibacteria bacterium]
MPSRKSVQAAAGEVALAVNHLGTAKSQADSAQERLSNVFAAFLEVTATVRQSVDDLEAEVLSAVEQATHATPEERQTLLSRVAARVTTFIESVNEPLVVSNTADAG